MRPRQAIKLLHFSWFKNGFATPPILIFFITSACNSRCGHCFYREGLNRRNDLSFEAIERASRSMGRLYQLLLSGGEPFLRPELTRVCKLFHDNNGLQELQIPTNSILCDTIHRTVGSILEQCPGLELTVNLSLDGTEKVHDAIRGVPGGFGKVFRNYGLLCEIKKAFSRFHMNVVSTITGDNVEDLSTLLDRVKQEMPMIDNHLFGYVRGRFYTDPATLPGREKLEELNRRRDELYGARPDKVYSRLLRRIDGVRLETLRRRCQVVPCVAGRLIGVMYEDGRISNCEMLPQTTALRDSFRDAWDDPARIKQLKEVILTRKCYCTHECFLSPSVVYSGVCKTLMSGLLGC